MDLNDKVIITCAVTGAIHTPSMSPHLPITAQEIADAAIGAAEAGAAVAGAEMRDRLEQLGFEPAISTPAELAAIHRSEYEVFRKAVQDDGIKFD